MVRSLMAASSLVCTSEGRVPRNATLEGFDLGDQVGDAGTELAEDRAELFLPPAAQGLDGKPQRMASSFSSGRCAVGAPVDGAGIRPMLRW